MSVEFGDVQHVHVPAPGTPYAIGAHVDLIKDPDGTAHLMPSHGGKFRVLTCNPVECNGIKLLNVGLMPA